MTENSIPTKNIKLCCPICKADTVLNVESELNVYDRYDQISVYVYVYLSCTECAWEQDLVEEINHD